MNQGQKITKPDLQANAAVGIGVGKPEFQNSESAYATQPDLQAMKPIGNGISAPSYQDSETEIASVKTADTTNSGTDLNITYDHTNRDAKWEWNRGGPSQDTGIMYSDQK